MAGPLRNPRRRAGGGIKKAFSMLLARQAGSKPAWHTGPGLSVVANLAVFALVVGGSTWSGSQSIDPHHWGLMLSNARDLLAGRAPYREIFIQYGILTTTVHALSLRLLGENLLALIVVSSAFYAAGLIVLARGAHRLAGDARTGVFVLLTCYAFHPVAIYPWSNYIAFPFLCYGVVRLADPRAGDAQQLACGLSLGLAVLAREGLAIPAGMVVACAIAAPFLSRRREGTDPVRTAAFLLGGLLCPLALFGAYLGASGLYPYWYKLSVLLPGIYIEESFPQL